MQATENAVNSMFNIIRATFKQADKQADKVSRVVNKALVSIEGLFYNFTICKDERTK